jgi:hypothetical protein
MYGLDGFARTFAATADRMTVQRASGPMQTIDLKNGTLIRPMGATPTQGEMAIVHGYYSNGTFIANSISLRV